MINTATPRAPCGMLMPLSRVGARASCQWAGEKIVNCYDMAGTMMVQCVEINLYEL